MSDERPTRICARPGCGAGAGVTLSFRYAVREVRLADLAREGGPHAYDLCGSHAARTRPPRGWTLIDERPEGQEAGAPGDFTRRSVDPRHVALGNARTVAVLAGVLARGSHEESATSGATGVEDVATTGRADPPPSVPGARAAHGAVRERGPSTARTW